MGERAVLYEAADRIGLITLNRPEQRNAMTPELLDAYSEAIGEAKADAGIRCLVVTGKGRCFSAGAMSTSFPGSLMAMNLMGGMSARVARPG